MNWHKDTPSLDQALINPLLVDLSLINKSAQLVTLHSPGDEQIITKDWIENAPSSQIIINTARANLIDEISLASSKYSKRKSESGTFPFNQR